MRLVAPVRVHPVAGARLPVADGHKGEEAPFFAHFSRPCGGTKPVDSICILVI